jgi:hypothetical protein
LEWHFQLKGDLVGSGYGYSIYAETTARSGVSAYVEIVLRSGKDESVLTRWRQGLIDTRNIEVFTGSLSGPDPDASAGDVLILRIGMNTPSSFHEYGSIWIGQQYPSYIIVPDFGNLTDVDLQSVRSELSDSQSQLEKIVQQQAESQAKLDRLADAVERLEQMVQGLTESRSKAELKEPGAAVAETAAPLNVRIRFSPSDLLLPTVQGDLFVCWLELDQKHNVSDVNLDSLRLIGPKGVLKADPALCTAGEQKESPLAGLRICFEAQKVAGLLDMGPNQAVFGTIELNGLMKDGLPFRGRGVIQVKKKGANIPSFPPQS